MEGLATTDLGRCLVTGGAGHLGRYLVEELARRGSAVRAFDRRAAGALPEGCQAVVGDVRDAEAVRRACEGVDTVFHSAAELCFLEHVRPEERERVHAINVGGAENVLRAAREAGVKRLVFTSSNNVTFDGPVIDGDETTPYVAKPRDLYTATKILAERRVLEANGEDGLLTCAIRPGGIYGPGDRVILPRLVDNLVRGLFVVRFGDPDAKSDNTFVENLADGHIEAARHLVPGAPTCGQAYFITDGHPVNYFEFFRPFVAGMGYRFPRLRIPGWPMALAAWAAEIVHRLGGPRPFLSRLEVRKVAISHYSRIDKAKRDFGWEPRVDYVTAVERCLPYCRELLEQAEVVDRPHWGWWVTIPAGMGLLAVLALSPAAHGWWSAHVTVWTPRALLLAVLACASLLHAHKGMKAVREAERAGLRRSSLRWGWQTLILGAPSLWSLHKRIERRRASSS